MSKINEAAATDLKPLKDYNTGWPKARREKQGIPCFISRSRISL